MENNTITCCLPIEIKSRELDARLFLACELARAGFTCLLGSKSVVHRRMGNMAPFLYFDKGLTPAQRDFCEDIHRNGGFIINLDEEGGIIEKGMFTFIARYPEELVPFYDMYFLWGHALKECLLENRKSVDATRLFVTGHPRFDLRKKKYEVLYKEKADLLREKYGNYILVNTSFAYANHVLGYEKGIRALPGHFGNEDHRKDGIDKAYYRLVQYYVVGAILHIAEQHPDIRIVVRPHPSELVRFYEDVFSGHDNISIIQEGCVQEWNMSALVVIHHDCTTAVEAAFSGIPTISYCPIRDNNFAPELPMLVSDVASSEAELMRLVDKYISERRERDILEEKKDIIRPWIANVDYDAATRIASCLAEKKLFFVEESKKRIARHGSQRVRKISMYALLGSIRLLARRIANRCCVWDVTERMRRREYACQKMPGIEKDELESKISSLAQINPEFAHIVVERLDADGFRISRASTEYNHSQ
ncbi:MAG: surface carbohydrate biosynthesis protein [bacterium]